MRDILFRAKDADGKWRYGYYAKANFVSYSRHLIYTENANDDYGLEHESFYVEENTVGQCVDNSTDKNGNRIFEGDIVSRKKFKYMIAWDKYSCSYVINMIDFDLIDDFDKDFAKDCEVIGNIYDNPELLKGVKK